MVERRLGRGLDFFLSSLGQAPAAGESIEHIELSRLVPSPNQPRHEFDAAELAALANSIRASGLLQPILVRRAGDRFEIIAGERRWRAAKDAGLERIPALVREVSEDNAAVYSLVENLQRTDLNAIEKAKAFRQIQTLAKMSQEEVARRVGLDRSTVSNFLRLLDLPEEVQAYVSRGTLSMGHARALVALPSTDDQMRVAQDAIRRRLSVRQLEELVQSLLALDSAANESQRFGKAKGKRPVWVKEIEDTLAQALGTKVSVRYGSRRSRITIDCVGRDQFESVYERIKTLSPE